ncbi:hypothetical protein LIER_30806 [Lithospermum erythrorhizon]|uniref:Uncharacterized protein n=1 Tax=Lithospermum erythrorhizon TaxID=34254 RepID=A0AAV3RSK7_LITER
MTTTALVWDSGEGASQSLGGESQVGLVPQPSIRQQAAVVDVDSSATVSNHSERQVSLHEDAVPPPSE